MNVPPLRCGSLIWVDLDPTQGREPAGRRPAVVIASDGYLGNVPALVIVVPITTTDRGWPHHVPIEGRAVELTRPSFAMTEQPRTIARSRVTGHAGAVDAATMRTLEQWVARFHRSLIDRSGGRSDAASVSAKRSAQEQRCCPPRWAAASEV